MDYGLALGIVIIIECAVILRGLVELSRSIESGLEELDSNMAGAIESIMSRFSPGGGMEPVNPIQMAIAELVKGKMQQAQESGPLTEMVRDASGKFDTPPKS